MCKLRQHHLFLDDIKLQSIHANRLSCHVPKSGKILRGCCKHSVFVGLMFILLQINCSFVKFCSHNRSTNDAGKTILMGGGMS